MNKPKNRFDVKTGNIENSQFAVGKDIKQEYTNSPDTDSKLEKIEYLLAELKKAIDDPNLSEEDKKQTSEQLKVLIEDYLTQVSSTKETEQSSQPIWAIAEDLIADLTESEKEQLPKDGAVQHDHYIYGTPKVD